MDIAELAQIDAEDHTLVTSIAQPIPVSPLSPMGRS